MNRLDVEIQKILDVCNNETAQVLCEDIRFWSQTHGEEDALKQAAVVLECVRAWVRDGERLAALRR